MAIIFGLEKKYDVDVLQGWINLNYLLNNNNNKIFSPKGVEMHENP